MNELLSSNRPLGTVLKKLNMIIPAETMGTSDQPLLQIRELADSLIDDEILDISLFPVQPWIDVSEVGFGITVVHAGNIERANECADVILSEDGGEFGELFIGRRHAGHGEDSPSTLGCGAKQKNSGNCPVGGFSEEASAWMNGRIRAGWSGAVDHDGLGGERGETGRMPSRGGGGEPVRCPRGFFLDNAGRERRSPRRFPR